MTAPTPPVLLFGSGVTILGAMRALGRAGVSVYVTCKHPLFMQRSRWFRQTPGPSNPGSAHDLAAYLEALPLETAVLLPCSDDWALAVASLDRSLADRFPSSVASPDVLAKLVDKGRFLEALDAAGVPHPRTVAVRDLADLDALDPGSLSSAFLKPRNSQEFFRRFGVKAFRPRDLGDLRSRLERLTADGMQMMIQDYVPGPASNHVFVDGFIDARGQVRSRFARRRLRMSPPDFGNSSYMRSVPLNEVAPAVDSVEALLVGLGYRGIFSAEFKQDERDGVFRMLEVNARPWWYVEFTQECGVNVCEQAYRDALGLPVDEVATYEVGRALVFPYYDAQACFRLWRGGELSLLAWARSWWGADWPVFSLDDPWPAVLQLARGARSFASRRWRRLRPPGT